MPACRFVTTRLALALVMALPLIGCQTTPAARPRAMVDVGAPPLSNEWKGEASDADEDRLARLGLAWQSALADAKKSNAGDVRREGVLLSPRAALARPDPTPGSYHCRLIKLGRTGKAGKSYESFKPFFCYIETEDQLFTLVKQTGSQRPSGRLWGDDGGRRLVFLGSMAMGEKDKTIAYGDDPKRDLAGVFERIGPFKWRLVVPWPQGPSKLDVYELTPVPDQPE